MSIINRNSGSPIYNTTAEAQAANLAIGQLPIVLGDSAAFDRGGKTYTVVANGSGGLPMSNGNELLPITGTVISRDTGTNPDEVPLNSDLGTASVVDIGSNPDQLSLNSAFGTASALNVGTAPGEIPTNSLLPTESATGGAFAAATFMKTGVLPTGFANPAGFTYPDDGTEAFYLETTNDLIVKLDSSTPFDVGTLSGTITQSYNYSATVVGGGINLTMKDDKTRFWICTDATQTIYQFDMSTPGDLTTVTPNGSLNVNAQVGALRDFAWFDDGNKFAALDRTATTLEEYNAGTAYDITSGVWSAQRQLNTSNTNLDSMAFNPAENRVLVSGSTLGRIEEFAIVTLGTANTNNDAAVNFVTTRPYNAYSACNYSPDGRFLYASSFQNGTIVVQYNTSLPNSL